MPSKTAIIQFEEQVKILTTMSVDTLWARMLGEFLGEWSRLQREGLAAAELEAGMLGFIEGLSSKPQEAIARTGAGVSYNQGRSAETVTAQALGEAEFVIRSEILDGATCDVCKTLDGFLIEIDSDAYLEFLPPAKCEGGDNCRGFYVVIPKKGIN